MSSDDYEEVIPLGAKAGDDPVGEELSRQVFSSDLSSIYDTTVDNITDDVAQDRVEGLVSDLLEPITKSGTYIVVEARRLPETLGAKLLERVNAD